MLTLIWFLVVLFFLGDLVFTVWFARTAGVLDVLALLLFMMIMGVRIFWRQGRYALSRIHRVVFKQRQVPGMLVVESVFLLVAAILLVLPGLLTGAAGFVLLVPRVRRRLSIWTRDLVLAWMSSRLL